MKTIQVRLSEEEEASLQERLRLSGHSISSLVRESLFPGTEAKLAQLPATAGQVEEIKKRLEELGEAVDRVKENMEAGCVHERDAEGYQGRLPMVVSSSPAPETQPETSLILSALHEISESLQRGKGGPIIEGAPTPAATQKALSEAREAERVADQVIESLRRFCRETLPGELLQVTQNAAQGMVWKSIEPLTSSARTATQEIDKCLARLIRTPWGWRLLLGPLIVGFVTVLVTGGLGYHLFFSSKVATMRRYAEWGELVERKLNKLSVKEREKFMKMIDLRP